MSNENSSNNPLANIFDSMKEIAEQQNFANPILAKPNGRRRIQAGVVLSVAGLEEMGIPGQLAQMVQMQPMPGYAISDGNMLQVAEEAFSAFPNIEKLGLRVEGTNEVYVAERHGNVISVSTENGQLTEHLQLNP